MDWKIKLITLLLQNSDKSCLIQINVGEIIPQIPSELVTRATGLLRFRSPPLSAVAEVISDVVAHMRQVTCAITQEVHVSEGRGRKLILGAGMPDDEGFSHLKAIAYAQFGEASRHPSFEFRVRSGRVRAFIPDYENETLGEPQSFPKAAKRRILRAVASGVVVKTN